MKIGKERIETMFSETSKTLPVETVDWNRLSPTYPFRFKGPAYLYCVWCEHFIRRVRPSSADLTCSDCGEVLAISCKVRGEEKNEGWMGNERHDDYFTFPHQWRPYGEGRRIVLDSE